MNHMRLQDYIRIIRKRWWIIALVPVIAAVSAYAFSKTQTSLYRSQARYTYQFNRIDTGGNMFAGPILNGYVNSVYRPDRLQTVANQLQIDKSGQELMRFVRLQPQPNSQLIVIEADWYDPATSQQLADAVGQLLNARVVEFNRNNISQDRLSLDMAPAQYAGIASPKTEINVLAGAILGLVLGVLLAFVLEYLDDTIKSAADIERYTELVTVGAIPSGAAQGGKRSRLGPLAASGIVAQPTHRGTDHDR
jgi:capsular polysaccharide biosynthesis protein